MNALSLPIGVRPLELIKGKSVCESNNIFDIPLDFFIFLIVIIGIVIVSSIEVMAIKKLKAAKSG